MQTVGVMLGPSDMALLSRRERYSIMVREARKASAEPIFFDREGIANDGLSVRGWVEEAGRWEERCTDLPAVIYNRAAYGNKRQSRAATRMLLTLAARRSTRLINSVNALSKMDVNQALRFFPGTAELAPETSRLILPGDLTEMLGRHAAVFVKENHGSHGSDVVRLHAEKGEVWIRGQIGARRIDERFHNAEQVCSFLRLLRPQADWMMQQGIELPSIDGRLFDLRAIAQKDGQGVWQVPLVLVRLAREGQVAANMSQGGEPFLPADFLGRYGGQLSLPDGFAQTVEDAARRTVLALESRFGRLGEVGIDIGLDPEGRPWIFEANTKPLHPTVPGMEAERLLRLPFAYGLYLIDRARAGKDSGLPSPIE